MENVFHCCASCQHYMVKREKTGLRTICERLGYDTRPTYQFDCWQPKPQVAKLMKKRGEANEEK